MDPLRLAKGVVFTLALLWSTFFGCLEILGPFVPLYWIWPEFNRRLFDFLKSTWFCYVNALGEIFFGVKVKFTGDELPGDENAILISNHRTYFDWLFLWMFVHRFGRLKNEHIVLKSPLKKIPGAGWAMQMFVFLFVRRRWEQDEQHMERVLRYFDDNKYPLQLLLFPEGTDLDDAAKKNSDKFAAKNGLPIYDYVLHPRTTGFVHCVRLLRRNITAIYDISIGYHDIPRSRFSLCMGNFPKEIHFNVKRYELKDLPQDDEGLAKWCLERWAEKEKLLKNFYSYPSPHFSSKEIFCAKDRKNRNFRLEQWCSLICWAIYSFYIGPKLMFFSNDFIFWYCVVWAVIFSVVTHAFGGFDSVILDLHFKNKKQVDGPSEKQQEEQQHENGKSTSISAAATTRSRNGSTRKPQKVE